MPLVVLVLTLPTNLLSLSPDQDKVASRFAPGEVALGAGSFPPLRHPAVAAVGLLVPLERDSRMQSLVAFLPGTEAVPDIVSGPFHECVPIDGEFLVQLSQLLKVTDIYAVVRYQTGHCSQKQAVLLPVGGNYAGCH